MKNLLKPIIQGFTPRKTDLINLTTGASLEGYSTMTNKQQIRALDYVMSLIKHYPSSASAYNVYHLLKTTRQEKYKRLPWYKRLFTHRS